MLLTLAFAALARLYVLSAGGCDFGKAEVVKETSEPHFLRGQEELRRGNISEALSAFLKVSEKRRDAPESHFELGRIYLEHMNDPNTAIYHFKKYLELKPNSPSSPMVRQMIETAQKKFAASLPESPFDSNIRRIELEEILQKQQKENLELKQKLAAAIATIDRLEATQNVRVEPRAQRRSAVALPPILRKLLPPTRRLPHSSVRRNNPAARNRRLKIRRPQEFPPSAATFLRHTSFRRATRFRA